MSECVTIFVGTPKLASTSTCATHIYLKDWKWGATFAPLFSQHSSISYTTTLAQVRDVLSNPVD